MPLFRRCPSFPQGSLAPVRVVLSRSIFAFYDPIRQSSRHAAISLFAYTQRLRCAGAPRRPAGPSLLSLLLFPSVPSTLPRGSAASTIPFSQSAVPGFLDLAASRHPPTPRLCQQYPTGVLFRGCIVRFILRPACLSSPPDWLRQDEVICSSPCLLRYIVTPAFDAVRYRTTLGVRLNGRTGNLPLLGLSPNQYQQLVRLHAKA